MKSFAVLGDRAKFGHQNYGVRPDIVTMAKGLTSAYSPLSATAVSAELYDSFQRARGLRAILDISIRSAGNPVSCMVAMKNLEILEREGLVARSAQIGNAFRARLDPLATHPHVGDIRIFGSAMGIELVEDQGSKIPATVERVMNIYPSMQKQGAAHR